MVGIDGVDLTTLDCLSPCFCLRSHRSLFCVLFFFQPSDSLKPVSHSYYTNSPLAFLSKSTGAKGVRRNMLSIIPDDILLEVAVAFERFIACKGTEQTW